MRKPGQEGGRSIPIRGGGSGVYGDPGLGPADAGTLSPQGLSGKDKELVLGLGHLNNSYNFSVSVCERLQPHLPPEWGPPG